MPFLRFTRDKRGYENTFLMHGFRYRGKARPRILYWFRTPPNVRVGRAALDEEAIRSIEEHNPELDFNWSRILQGHVDLPASETHGAGAERDRAAAGAPQAGVPAKPHTEPLGAHGIRHEPPPGAAGGSERRKRRRSRRRGGQPGASVTAEPTAPVSVVGPDRGADAAVVAEVAAEQPSPETAATLLNDDLEVIERDAGHQAPGYGPSSAVESIVGAEQLGRLRARYAEILARISQRVTDPARLEQLRDEAEKLNPDAWVTADEVRRSLDGFEAAYQALRAGLGGRRRRSRRGGVRRTRRRHRLAASGVTDASAAKPSAVEDASTEAGEEPEPGSEPK